MLMKIRWILVVAAVALLQNMSPHAAELDLTGQRIVDLSHVFSEHTIYWPTSPGRFELTELARGPTAGGWFYSAYSLSTPEHGGTHIDAPVHFSQEGQSVDAIPLGNLIGPAVVIDISEQAKADPDYLLTLGDIDAFEAAHGPIGSGSMVLLRTGWSQRWPDAMAYMGDATPGDASRLHFPSFGPEAARFLIHDRGAKVLGVDTASIDGGQSRDFRVHRMAGRHNVPGLENLTNLEQLPPTGATVIALPMKIEGGSGGPVRVVAFVPE